MIIARVSGAPTILGVSLSNTHIHQGQDPSSDGRSRSSRRTCCDKMLYRRASIEAHTLAKIMSRTLSHTDGVS